jgi:hypothetical protein
MVLCLSRCCQVPYKVHEGVQNSGLMWVNPAWPVYRHIHVLCMQLRYAWFAFGRCLITDELRCFPDKGSSCLTHLGVQLCLSSPCFVSVVHVVNVCNRQVYVSFLDHEKTDKSIFYFAMAYHEM